MEEEVAWCQNDREEPSNTNRHLEVIVAWLECVGDLDGEWELWEHEQVLHPYVLDAISDGNKDSKHGDCRWCKEKHWNDTDCEPWILEEVLDHKIQVE